MDVSFTTPTSRTSLEAKADAVLWLEEYREISAYEWEWHTPTTLTCEPQPRFPCYVMAVATPREDDGYDPSLAFTAGTKQKGGYWQGMIPGGDLLGLSREELSRLDAVLGVLITAALLPLSPPT